MNAQSYGKPTEEVRNEDLRVGDTCILWCGVWRVTALYPYQGPLGDIILRVADTDQGSGFSLERGGWTLIAKRHEEAKE